MLIELADAMPETFDVVVIGAGGAGMYTALCAGIAGASVLLVERTEYVGGTTAYSGGTTWIPGTSHAASVAPDDTLDIAEAYLTRAIGDRTSAALRRAFLDNGPRAVAHIEANSEVRFRAYPLHPDYLSEIEGSTEKGRALEPLPFDGRGLGELFTLIRPPIPEFTVLGGMMVDRGDIGHLLRMTKRLVSLRYSVRLVARHVADRLHYSRGTRLVMGNALVGRLLSSLAKRSNVAMLMRTSLERFHVDDAGVFAVTLLKDGARRTIRVRGGIVLATGGFNRHAQRRAQMLPQIDAAWCAGAPGHTGDAHDLALGIGAQYGVGALSHAYFAPVSLRKRADGSTAVFPHFLLDRAKPGTITVDGSGKRFVNESTSYHLFALRMLEANQGSSAIPAFLVADAAAVRNYGIGMVRPGSRRLDRFVADGYLTMGSSLRELASQLRIDADNLEHTVDRFNSMVEDGVDRDFRRGTTAYERNLGDATSEGRNPTLGPLFEPPFYAVRLYPGDIGAATGLLTDAKGRVLDAESRTIPGLYAVGNDMHSIMGGVYTGPGITLGPALVFGYVAGRHAARRARTATLTATASAIDLARHKKSA